MNLIECYIKEIKSVEPYEAEWTKEFPSKKFVKVKVVVDCYGRIDERETIETEESWEEAKIRGYFLW